MPRLLWAYVGILVGPAYVVSTPFRRNVKNERKGSIVSIAVACFGSISAIAESGEARVRGNWFWMGLEVDEDVEDASWGRIDAYPRLGEDVSTVAPLTGTFILTNLSTAMMLFPVVLSPWSFPR